ncbi:MAG TPA: chloride channel protein [Pirellulales bacterium]|nr:chloride channel protein [Pirellulales bacterium]
MTDREAARSAAKDGLTVAPSLDLVLEAAQVPPQYVMVDRRVLQICGLAILLGIAAAFVAVVLVNVINFVTNLAFFGRFSLADVSPAENHLGLLVVVVPIIGSLFVGFMARYGSKAIRGHGIPEAMEQVLTNQSRIPARLTFLKPLSAAISIGTGGPFGAEGPIIATGGALGSVIGQIIRVTAAERKTLLAAGAAAGMAAIFGSPVSAVLLAIELLLFEFRPRSIIPVALASASATSVHIILEGFEPAFAMQPLDHPTGAALAIYIVIGALVGLASVGVTRMTYAVEDAFERLPIHWMWWPALGAVAVGVIGYFAPRTLGVGYENISDLISDKLTLEAAIWLCGLKFVSWSVSLGSGTSGGTLAPLFTIGAGLGVVFGAAAAALFPDFAIEIRIAALVGMAAMFAGASRALLTSVVFAFETTLQPLGLLPLLGGCTASYLVSCLLMRHSIMTEKIARRGIRTPAEYVPDLLEQVLVRDVASKNVVALKAQDTLEQTREWLQSEGAGTLHSGFPVLNERGVLVGVLTRRDLETTSAEAAVRLQDLVVRLPKYVYDDCTVRQAADHMVNHGIGRLPVVLRSQPSQLIGIVTRSDILSVYRRSVEEAQTEAPNIKLRVPKLRRGKNASKSR